MKIRWRTRFLMALLLVLSACGKSDSIGENNQSNPAQQEQPTEPSHQDLFTFRNSETGEVLPEDQLPGKLQNPAYTYLGGSAIKWNYGIVKWWYNPAGQPAGMATQDVIDNLIASTKRWEQVCKISFQYQGTTSNQLSLSGCNGSTVVGWTALAGDVIGQTQACFSGSAIGEMDLALDNTQIGNLSLLQNVAVHEFGHGIGLGHTDVSPAVMTPYLTTGTPVQDDINGCQSLYGAPSTTTTSPTPPPAPLCQAGSTQACSTTSGTGYRTCSSDGSTWSSCRITQCKPGYKMYYGRCYRVY